MQIQIDIPRPLTLMVTLTAFGGLLHWFMHDPRLLPAPLQASVIAVEMSSSSAHVEHDEFPKAQGGDAASTSERSVQIQSEISNERALQALLKQKEELLRYQLDILAGERKALGNDITPELEEEFRESVRALTSLILDQKQSEAFLLSAFNELFEAEGRMARLATSAFNGTISLIWPVEPLLGISATFHDPAYKSRFGFEHNAVDIPVPQGTLILAAADGIVKDVVDNGLGFNYITIQHAGGSYATLYGHLSKLLVQPGQRVYAGQELGLSGGRPGTPGAGFSTGPHLHFALRLQGSAIDPLPHLPSVEAEQAKYSDDSTHGSEFSSW